MVCHWMRDIIDRLYTMLITPPTNFGVTSRKDNRVYLRRRVITFLVQFLHTLLGGYNAKTVGFWGSYSAPPDPLAGREGAPLPICPTLCHTLIFAPPPPPPRSQFLDPPLRGASYVFMLYIRAIRNKVV